MVCLLAWLDHLFCLRFLLCMLCHELGHLLALKLCRVRVERIRLTAAGAVIGTSCLSYKTELLCAAAGPLAGIVLGLSLIRVLPQTAVVSFLLSLVNLLPVFPLDGGRLLRAGLSLCCTEKNVTATMRIVTAIVCSVLMLLACWGAVCLQMGLWPIFAALVLLCRVADRE